jgi:hypothetical protein
LFGGVPGVEACLYGTVTQVQNARQNARNATDRKNSKCNENSATSGGNFGPISNLRRHLEREIPRNDEWMTSQLLSCPIIFKRINEALLAHAITYVRNTKDLFKMAKQTTRSTTTKRLLLAEPTCLKLADAINRAIRRMR